MALKKRKNGGKTKRITKASGRAPRKKRRPAPRRSPLRVALPLKQYELAQTPAQEPPGADVAHLASLPIENPRKGARA